MSMSTNDREKIPLCRPAKTGKTTRNDRNASALTIMSPFPKQSAAELQKTKQLSKLSIKESIII